VRRGAALIAAALAIAGAGCKTDAPRIAIGVSASLRYAMPELVDRYRTTTGVTIDVTYGAADTVTSGAKRGAAFDAVVLADRALVDQLVALGAIAVDTRRTVATNAIVLVGPAGSTETFATMAATTGRLAVGDPATVPVGRYARAYLESSGGWDAMRPRLVYGGDVAGVLALAQRGEATFAIVYRTDAAHAAPLVVLDAPADAPTVDLDAGVLAASGRADAARRFLDFLGSPNGQAILAKHGFGPRR
jgi:molybdate transport system substrate-binding protein